jgi:hypothetical protein
MYETKKITNILQAQIRKIKSELFSNLKISYEPLEKNREARLKIEVSFTKTVI